MKHNVKIAPEKRKDKTGQIIVKNVPLFADIRFAGTRLFYFTGYRIDADKFNTETQEVRKNSSGYEGKREVQYNLINKRLNAIKAALVLFFQDKDKATKEQVTTLLDEVCKKSDTVESESPGSEFFEMFNHYLNMAKLSAGRKKTILNVINHWQRYADKRGIKITFERITVDLLRDFDKYLMEESTKPKSRNSKELVRSPKGRNTTHKILAMTRAYWNFARKELKQKGIELPQIFGTDGFQLQGESYGKPVYITSSERDLLFGADIESERLRRVRDIFVFQCYIGARVGDLCKLTKANIQNNVISFIPRKTKDNKPVTVNIPLHQKALEILSRYNILDGRLLPFITDQRYNDYLKELFEKVGLTRIVTRLNPTTGEPELIRLCDIASSHMARRTFIGNLYGKIESDVIGSMTAHSPGSKAFTRYYDISEELQQAAIDKL